MQSEVRRDEHGGEGSGQGTVVIAKLVGGRCPRAVRDLVVDRGLGGIKPVRCESRQALVSVVRHRSAFC